MTKGVAGFVRDNLEAFAVAIAMALVIRHFCLEAFRIPTKSMKPTLLGDEPPNGGDRILVDKFAYLRRKPRRFEVTVFRFPLNQSRNYIKRLVGLPGEWLRVVDGDIWTSRDEGKTWRIERKPDGVQEQLFFPYYPVPYGEDAYERLPKTGNWESDNAWVVSEIDNRYKVEARADAATLRFLRRPLPYGGVDRGAGRPGKPWVGDVRMSFEIEVEKAGKLELILQEHGRRHRLILAPDKSEVVLISDDGERTYPLDFRLESGEEYEISFANVDERLIVEIDGDRVLEQDFPEMAPQPPDLQVPEFNGTAPAPQWNHDIAVRATGITATLTEMRIDRDIYYNSRPDQGSVESPDRIWKIPDGHYFMLGDNTRQSSDSRRWHRAEAKLKDGTVIRWQEPGASSEPNHNPEADGLVPGTNEDVVIAVDVNGLVRRFNTNDLAEPPHSHIPSPYVPEDHLVGRAFAIFWPIHIPGGVRGPTRVNLIR